MKKLANLATFLVAFLTTVIVLTCSFYNFNIKAVSKDNTPKEFMVNEGSTFATLAHDLKQENLIRSELCYKIYVKIFHPEGLQAGPYELKESMNVKEIIEVLSSGNTYNPDSITVTFQEGLPMQKVASIIAQNTNNKEEDVFNLLQNDNYLNSLINQYWFLTEDIKNKEIYYPLEGYLFPDTYAFQNKNVAVEDIFKAMLENMQKKLEPYKEKIQKSNYSIHEIITLASMIQSEGNNIEDFKKMASVFLTRLDRGMQLQSCASAYYGDKKIMGIDEFGDSYLKENSYNTYTISALPVGAISNPGIDAIEAVLNPAETNYLYFASDKNMKVYFSGTYQEHQNVIASLIESGNWYGS